MRGEDLYHIGVVVDDYEATLERLTTLFGYRFGEEVRVMNRVRFPDGSVRDLQAAFCYSLDSPYIEVVRSQPGTPWVPSDSGAHHLGYWSDDVAADCERLLGAGFESEMVGLGPDDSPTWAYCRHPTGLRIELVTRFAKPMMDQYWSDGVNRFG